MRKTALKIGLLLFVAASIVAAMVRGTMRPNDTALAVIAPDRHDAVVVCYLRSQFRCPACTMLEACSRDTVEQEFAMKRQLFLCEQGYSYDIRMAGTVSAAGSGVPAGPGAPDARA